MTSERRPPETESTAQEYGEQHESEQRVIGVGCRRDDRQAHHDHTDDTPGHSESPTGHSLGYYPPETADRDGEADKGKDQIAEMADAEDHDRHGQEQTAGERADASPRSLQFTRRGSRPSDFSDALMPDLLPVNVKHRAGRGVGFDLSPAEDSCTLAIALIVVTSAP